MLAGCHSVKVLTNNPTNYKGVKDIPCIVERDGVDTKVWDRCTWDRTGKNIVAEYKNGN